MRMKWCLVLVVLVLALSGRVHAGDREDIVGRWNYCADERCYLRLNADGTFKLVAVFRTIEGTYRLLDDGYLELDTPGLIYGRNKDEVKYRLTQDALEFKVGETLGKYQRAK